MGNYLLPLRRSVSINTDHFNSTPDKIVILTNENSPIKKVTVIGSLGQYDPGSYNNLKAQGIALLKDTQENIFDNYETKFYLEH
jgi:hypothetical protein